MNQVTWIHFAGLSSRVVGFIGLVLMSAVVALGQHGDHEAMNDPTHTFPAWTDLPDSLTSAFIRDYGDWGPDSAFAHYYGAVGPRAMLDYVEARFPRCHGVAHGLGSIIYEEVGDLGQSLSICTDRCSNACMHGVIRRAFGGHSLEDVVANSGEVCSVEEMRGDTRPGACPHALGHAFVVTSDYDVPPSLDACETFPSRFETYRCAMGVFMEYRAMPRERRESVEGNPWTYDCDANPKYAVACYRYMLQNQTGVHRLDFDVGVEECLSRSGRSKLACFHAFGMRFSGTVFDDPAKLAEVCAHGDHDDKIVCIEGIVENMSIHDKPKAFASCESLSGDLKQICLDAAEGGYYRVDKPTMSLYLPD